MMRQSLVFMAGLCLCSTALCAPWTTQDKFKYRFYAGFGFGYGATTWGALVPLPAKQNEAISISTPKVVDEGGSMWGTFLGYEFLPWFALEAAYMHYPVAGVTFDQESIFSYDHDGKETFHTKTDTISLMAKVMFLIPQTEFRLFSSFGPAFVFRNDLIKDDARFSPSFGAGINYNITPNLMTEFGGNYIAGFGESELDPCKDYFPFVYSIFFRIAVRF